MKQHKKFFIITIALATLFALSSMSFSNSQSNFRFEEDYISQTTDLISNEIEVFNENDFIILDDFEETEEPIVSEKNTPYTPKSSETNSSEENTFEYYRDIYLGLCNVSLEYYSNLTEDTFESAITHICAIWGYYNGTYTEEEMNNMTRSNSPLISFGTSVYDPSDGTYHWGYSPNPSPESIKRHDDEEFRVGFRIKMAAELGEHTTSVNAYMITNTEVTMYFHEVDDFWGLGHAAGTYYQGDGLYGIWGYGHVDMEIYRPTYFRDTTVQFKIVAHWWDLVGLLYESRTLTKIYTYTYNVEAWVDFNFPFIHVNYINQQPITIVDDDPFAPAIGITDSNLIDNTYLYDGEQYLNLVGYVHDWWVLGSGVSYPIYQSNGKRELWHQEISDPLYDYTFAVRFENPRELGVYNASIAVWDQDTDVANDRLLNNRTIYFEVMDDDTTAPSIDIERILGDGTDANPGYWHVTVNDPESGISNVYVDVAGLGTLSTTQTEFLVPVNAHPFYNQITVTAYNNDLDRGSKDRESNSVITWDSVGLIDDDLTAPIVFITHQDGNGYDSQPGYWTVSAYDPESGIGAVEVKVDGTLVGYSLNDYNVPNTPGPHIIEAKVSNADEDYAGDSLANDIETAIASYSVYIQDDDVSPPHISIVPYSSATDSNPGFWSVSASDSSGITQMYVYIDEILVGTSNDNFDIPNTLGNHIIRVEATDGDSDRYGDSLTGSFSHVITMVDDDLTAPIIDITPFGSGTDADAGGWTVNAYDLESGIETIEVYLDDILVGTSNGDYFLQGSLGDYTLRVVATNADFDRGIEDQESSENLNLISIIDDDPSPPTIEILYCGSGTDGDAGYWTVNAFDIDSGIDGVEIYIDAIFAGGSLGDYLVPNDLGDHTIRVVAYNADIDRGSSDQESNEDSNMITIVDDDLGSPVINNLQILEEIYYLNINFEAYDDSGIGSISLTIDGKLQIFYEPTMLETYFEFFVFNEWVAEIGTHEILIEVWDNDYDRYGDSLYTSITTSFEVSVNELKDFVLWEVEELRKYISGSPDCWWSHKNRKDTMLNKVDALQNKINNNEFSCAYSSLLHDIKPKLTGLKMDENGAIWGGLFYQNPWIINPGAQFQFCIRCDQILHHLVILHENPYQTMLYGEIPKPQLGTIYENKILMISSILAFMGLIYSKLTKLQFK